MELEPRVLFFLIVALPPILIGTMALGVMGILYLLDRSVRQVRVQAADMKSPSMAAVVGPAPSPVVLSPVSRYVTARGRLDAAPSMGVPSSKLGMWVFLASEVMFFTALIGAYVAFRARDAIVVPDTLNMPLSALNTFILIVSSFTVVLALDAIQHDNQSRFVLLMLATLALGGTFVAIQGFEWKELLFHGITPASELFGTAFFVLTGFHGMHVIVGLLALVFLLLKALRGDFSSERYLGFEVFGLYWHFVDVVWIVLFTLIYLVE